MSWFLPKEIHLLWQWIWKQSKMTSKYSVFFAYLTNYWLSTLSEILIDLVRFITASVYLLSSIVKPHWHAAYGALMAKHLAERWARVYWSSRKKTPHISRLQCNYYICCSLIIIITIIIIIIIKLIIIISSIPFILEALDIETLLHQTTIHCGFLRTINSCSTYQCTTIIITPETITKQLLLYK